MKLKLNMEMMMGMGKKCDCGKRYLHPEHHDVNCSWRKEAEASMAEDQAEQRVNEDDGC